MVHFKQTLTFYDQNTSLYTTILQTGSALFPSTYLVLAFNCIVVCVATLHTVHSKFGLFIVYYDAAIRMSQRSRIKVARY